MAIDPQILRAAMRNWATGVTVVTATYESQRAGATVSSFTSITLDPPMILVCLNKTTYVHDLIRHSAAYGVSLLAHDQEALSNRFAGLESNVTDRFEGVTTHTLETGSPLLGGAIAWLDCRLEQALGIGTHTVYVGSVVGVQVNSDAMPLVYFNRGYKRLSE
jgi:flavin reductase (DIM6/NTAB) family NADH-FMN oxidoreductase RutF